MDKYQKGVIAAMKQLSNALTRNDIGKIQISLAIPNRITEIVKASNDPGRKLLTQLKSWEEFSPVEFMLAIEETSNRELISLARKIPWLNTSAKQQVATEKKTAHNFLNLLRDVAADDWKLIGHNLTSDNTEEILNCCIQDGIVTKDLTALCDVMTEIERDDLVPKIQNYASLFEGLSEEEFKTKLLSEIEYEEDNHSQWMRKLREYMLLQHRDVSVILDRDMVALESVYTPLTVIRQETYQIKPEEETTIKEIEFLRQLKDEIEMYEFKREVEPPEYVEMDDYAREMNGCEAKSGIVDFETHLSYCRTEEPQIWTLIGNPGCGKTFLYKYAGYNYGKDNIENFKYLLSIPCRDTEWHAIEVARQEDKEINRYIRRWLRISLPLGVGWAESLTRYIMRTGGESLLLIIDGLDEFIKTVPFDTTLLYLLLQKRILPSATILLTSRPGAWSNVSTLYGNEIKINKHYQVLGFSPENRNAYFKKRMISKSKLVETHKLFQRHEELSLLALVPVNASLFSALLNDTEDILAITITDVYQELITYMVRRQLSRMGLKRYTKVSHISNFAPKIKRCISVIGEEAYKGIYDRELVCKDDTTLCLGEKEYKCERLGLMQEHFVVLKLVGRVKVWVYAHLTLQEFMSAVWLSYQKWTRQCLITRYLVSSDDLFFMFKMVVRFVCGILCERAGAMLAILCKKLIPYTTQQIPMFYLLGYDIEMSGYHSYAPILNTEFRMINLSNWKEFLRYFFDIISIILESKPGSSLLKNIIPEPLHCYFVSTISPNEWYTFLLSLPHLPHIQIIFIDVRYISTEQFHSLVSQIEQCSLNYLALTFHNECTSTFLSYTSIISSIMPAHIKINIKLNKFLDFSDSDTLFPPPSNQFTGSLGVCYSDLSEECITNLLSNFSSIQYFCYIPNTRPHWSVKELIIQYKPSNGLFLFEPLRISLEVFSHLSSLQEIHLRTEDPYSVLPYLHSYYNLTYLAIEPTVSPPHRKSYRDNLIKITNRNRNTLRGIKFCYLDTIGINSWDNALDAIQHCDKLIELVISFISLYDTEDIISKNTNTEYLQSLIRLYLYGIPLSSSDVYTLCNGLAYSPVIKEIEIHYCELISTSCAHFIHLIPTLPELKGLFFHGNRLSSPDPTQLKILRQIAEGYSVEVHT